MSQLRGIRELIGMELSDSQNKRRAGIPGSLSFLSLLFMINEKFAIASKRSFGIFGCHKKLGSESND